MLLFFIKKKNYKLPVYAIKIPFSIRRSFFVEFSKIKIVIKGEISSCDELDRPVQLVMWRFDFLL